MLFRFAVFALAVGLGWSAQAEAEDGVRLNQIQVIGSHNSYHVAPHPNVLGLVDQGGRGRSGALDYTHRPFAEQFSRLGIRQIELDVFADPKGGHYAKPAARAILQGKGLEPGGDPCSDERLLQPGLKVFHVQDVDYLTRATTFADALGQVLDWSTAHPRHVPIMILVETKEAAIAALPTRPMPFTKAELDGVDAEILKVFGRGRVITPDDLRGDSETLPEAIRSRGWPLLEASRGKVLFGLDDEGSMRDTYLEGHPSLRGRLMFVSVPPDHPAAAWMKMNESVEDFDRIQKLVRDGFLVRTRADADTVQARKNDPSMREKALSSGAQFVSTDYPEPDLRFSTYQVRFPESVVARSNPVNGPKVEGDLEALPKSSR